MKLLKSKTSYMVLAFLVGALLMLGNCEDAQADWAIEHAHDSNAGTTSFNHGLDRICGRYIFASSSSFVACPLLAVGGEVESGFEIGFTEKFGKRYEAQLTLNQFDGEVDGGFTVRRVIGDGPFNLFLGGSYWIDQSPGSNSYFTFNLGMRYTFNAN